MSKSLLDIEYEWIMTLKHPKHPFPAIYWCSGQFRSLWKKLNFWPKSHFFIFWVIFHMISRMAGSGRKHHYSIKMPSLSPKHVSTSLGSRYSIWRAFFATFEKITISHKICTFCDFLKNHKKYKFHEKS